MGQECVAAASGKKWLFRAAGIAALVQLIVSFIAVGIAVLAGPALTTVSGYFAMLQDNRLAGSTI